MFIRIIRTPDNSHNVMDFDHISNEKIAELMVPFESNSYENEYFDLVRFKEHESIWKKEYLALRMKKNICLENTNSVSPINSFFMIDPNTFKIKNKAYAYNNEVMSKIVNKDQLQNEINEMNKHNTKGLIATIREKFSKNTNRNDSKNGIK